MAEEALAVVHRKAARMPVEQDGHNFAIGDDTSVLGEALILVPHRHCHLRIHLLRLMMLARAMGRARSRRSTLARMVR